MTILFSDDVKSLMEERGICEDDVKDVVKYAEAGDKLVDESTGKNLGKKRLENFTVYVEYKISGEEVEVINTYSHRVELAEDR